MGSEDYAGWITFGTKIDNKYFEREIRKAAKELEKLDDKRKELEKKQDKIDIEFNIDKENLDKQYQKMIDRLKQDRDAQKKLNWSPFEEEWYGKRLGGINQWYEKELQGISKKHDDIKEKIDTVNGKYKDTKKIMDELIGKYDEFKNKNGDDGDEDKGSPISPKKLAKSGKGLESIIRKVTRWGLALFGIRGAYSMIRKAMADISQENKQVGADIEYMRWAISKTLEPVIVRLVSWFMKLMQAINYVVYRLSGGKITLFAQATADNFKKASGSAKELQKTLAGFDEMNIVGSQSTGGGGGVSLPSEDLNDFSTLSDSLKDKLNWIADKLLWIKENIFDPIWKWIKENPEGFGMILGTLVSASVLAKIASLIGVGGSVATASGLLGVIFCLSMLTAGVWTITINYLETKKQIDETNKVVKESSNNWEDLRNEMALSAIQGKNSDKQNRQLVKGIIDNTRANDTLRDSYDDTIDTLSSVSYMTGITASECMDLTKKQGELTDEQWRNLQVMDALYKAGLLEDDEKLIYIELLQDVRDNLEEDNKFLGINSDKYKTNAKRIHDVDDRLKNLTGHDWYYELKDNGSVDETKQKVQEVGDLLKDTVDRTYETKISADTKPANKKISSWLSNIGSTAFGVLFSGVGITYSSLLNKFKNYAKGGIVNLPGRGVPIGIGGEAGREGVIPLTDEQQMQLLGESIGKYITINLTNITKLDSREINRKNEKVKSENTFIRNR